MTSQKHHHGDAEPGPDTPSGVIRTDRPRARSPYYAEGEILAGRFQIVSLVAAGGMGTVYRARDVELDEDVAVKVLRRDLELGSSSLDRFRREVKLARRIAHHNVARVFDIYENGHDRFLAMEFVDGEPLSAQIARSGPQPVEVVLAIACGICDGLAAAHAAGIVHRDLKPDNILLTPEGRVVLTDFGIARHLYEAVEGSSMGMTLGTPAYMAPEQIENEAVDARADIYALGAVLYELFTGQRVWPGDSPFAVATARLLSPPPDPRALRPDIPDDAAETVLRCLARYAKDRFDSAEEVRLQLLGPTATGERRIVVQAPPIIPSAPPPDAAASRRETRTLAVLFFRNAGPSLDDYLAEELTDDLIDGLAATGRFKVRPRGAVERFANVSVDPADVGRELGVEAVIEGSVRRYGDRVRINTRLIQVEDGFQIWAKRFDRLASEVLEVNDTLVRAVAQTLSVEVDNVTRVLPSNAAAIDLFLRGRHEARKLWPENLTRAIELYEQAEALAPDMPLLLAAKATALARRSIFTGAGLNDARSAAERAVALAPQLAEARLSLGQVLIQQGEGAAGVREMAKAIEVQPAFAEAHAAIGVVLAETDLLNEGVRHLELALSSEADNPTAIASLARAHALRSGMAAGHATLDQHRQRVGPGYHEVTRARLILWERDRARAQAMLEDLDRAVDGALTARLLLRAALGDLTALHAAEAQARGDARPRAFIFQIGAEGRAAAGDMAGALEAIERYGALGMSDVAWLDRCPLFAELRGDPRFGAVRDIVAWRAAEVVHAYLAAQSAGEVSPPTYRSGAGWQRT